MATDLLGAGNELLEAGRWEEAKRTFEQAGSSHGNPDALLGLATASRWLDDIGGAIDKLGQAYRGFVDAGRDVDAALAALSLAELFSDYRGEPAVASGWLQRALDRLRDVPDHPLMVVINGMQAYLAFAYDKDPATARSLVESALEHARQLGNREAELMAKAQLGLIMVCQGEVVYGMRLLDESTAAATAGELSRQEGAETYCMLITACERVRDFDRLAQWARRVMKLASESDTANFGTFARTQYANVLIWTGKWNEAEEQLSTVVEDAEQRPLTAAMAMVLLASLSRRQGDLERADEILRRAEREPFRSGVRHMVLTGRASLELERGDPQTAADFADRYLRAVPAEDPAERIEALEVLVRAMANMGEVEKAHTAAGELSEIATNIPTDAIRGAARAAYGLASLASGDHDAARRALEEAVVLYDTAGVPQESVRARLDLAEVQLEGGQPDVARREALAARESASQLGAMADVGRADRILGALQPSPTPPMGLTERETEVLRLLASGQTNTEIAESLFVSRRTVERHISNVYAKIGVFGRSGRAAATAFAHRHGLT